MTAPLPPPTNRPRPAEAKIGPTRRKPQRGLANGLVALSSAAVIAVYAAGYARTAPAVESLAAGEFAAGAAQVPTAAPVSPTPAATATTAPTATTALTATAIASTAPVARQRGGQADQAVPGGATSGGTTAQPATAPTATAVPSTAPSAAPTATTTTSSSVAAFRDGTYSGTGTSRHGSIGVTVTIQGGTITAATITDCGTRYPCSRIAALPGQVLARQSAAVDGVTGATDSTNAYRAAVNAALAQAR